jgi:CspA family cold shock protein
MDDVSKTYLGLVVWFSKGYGFIKPDIGDKDIFVHFSDLEILGFKTLQKGERVSYKIGKNKRGQDKAIDVSVIK